MRNHTFFRLNQRLPMWLLLLAAWGCERDIQDLEPVALPTNPEVFIETFSPGLNYAAFGGSVPTAFQVDNNTSYNNSAASMRFDVPNVGDPRGAYAGGTFFTSGPRNLSGYNALSFWAKASQAVDLDIVGFGNDLGASRNQTSISGLKLSTSWARYIIPIPDPNQLSAERGMLFYSAGPKDGNGYTFWMDEVKYEKLGTLAHQSAAILNGQAVEITSENGETIRLDGLSSTHNLPSGIDQRVNLTPYFFNFESSNPTVATVNEEGIVTVLNSGTAVITAKLGNLDAAGSLTITSIGEAIKPANAAPTPTRDPAKVISMYTNVYQNVPVDTWNTRWQFSTAEEHFVNLFGQDMIRYRNLNFVGIEFASQKINASGMTHFHLDIWTPDPTNPPRNFKVMLVDFGVNGQFGGGDDSSHEISFSSPTLSTQNWVSLDIPLSQFSSLLSRANLAQLVLSGDLPNLYLTNVYFYNDGAAPQVPTTPPPSPSSNPANVISVFSAAYNSIPGTNLNPNWGQATVVTTENVQGVNTLKYSGLNYQGIQLGSNQNLSGMNFLHIDYWTANSSALSVFLISPGPIETPYALTVPTTGWASVDIPLSAFAPVNLSNVFQLKFEGNGDIYLGNIYFRN